MNWKPALVVCLIFVLGAGAGSLGTIAWQRQHPVPVPVKQAEHDGGSYMMRKLSSELKLDEAQREQLKGILAEMYREMKEVRHEINPRAKGIIERQDQRIRGILRPEQQSRFDEMIAERRQRWEKFKAE